MTNSTLTPASTPVAPVARLVGGDTMDGIESTDLTGDLFGETPAEAEETEKEREEEKEEKEEEDEEEEGSTEKVNGDDESMALAVVDANEIVPAKKLTFVDYLSSPIVTITVGESVLTAHLALLQRSPFFDASLNVDGLMDENIDAVGCFLQYLYTNEYTPRLIPSVAHPGEMVLESVAIDEIDEDGSHLLKHARVYTLAEKLGMEELKTLAHSKIHRINSTAKGELEYARFVYANTPREDKTIRNPIATFWAHRSHVLRHEAEKEFMGMILEFPQFAYDILSMVLDQKERVKDRGRAGDRDDREGASLTDMGPPVAEKRPGSNRKRPRTSTLL